MELDQEDRVPDTRFSSKKRALMAQSSLPEPSLSKKRVALGELTNSPDLGSSQDPKFRSKSDSNQSEPTPELEEPNDKIDETVGDLKKCSFSSIYEYLHSLEIEEKRRPLHNYLEKVQKDITVNMREILIEWLVEVTEEYKLVSDTLYLTVSFIDRFLSSHVISRNKLQLLGVSCMFIASKYEEITPPHIDEFCYITDNSYTKEEVVQMEKDVLKLLNFEVGGNPTTRNFLRTLMRAAQEKDKCRELHMELLSCYLAELSLLDYGCVQFLPSMVASSAMFLSRFMINANIHPWSKALECYSGYRPSDLKECVLAIHGLHVNRNGSHLKAVTEKYMQHKFKYIAVSPSLPGVPGWCFEDVDE